MKRKVTALLLAMAFVLATVAPTLAAGNEEKAGGNQTATESAENANNSNVTSDNNGDSKKDTYIGYSDGATGNIEKLYVEQGPKKNKANQSARRVVYCYNKQKAWPLTYRLTKDLAYEKVTGDAEVFKKNVDSKSPYKDKDLIEKLKIVLLNGYPNSYAIQKSLSLSGDEMREVTQMAVWHFTDNLYSDLSKDLDVDKKQVIALGLLLTQAESDTLDKEVWNKILEKYKEKNSEFEAPKAKTMPKNATLDLYVSNGVKAADEKKYQDLLGAQLINSKTKKVIDVSKTTEPTEKETKISKTITFSLQDIFGNELSGAKLQIKEKDAEKDTAKVIKDWTSGETLASYTLEAGKSYEFVQTEAPKGYEAAKPIEFTIDEKGNVTPDNVLVMVNDYKEDHIFYSVKDIAGNELAGATLRIVTRDGKLVESWTTDKTPKSIKLKGGSYRLELVQGPQGNEVAEAVDFTIFGEGDIEAETEGHLEKFKNHKMLYLTAKHEEINFYFGLRDILDRELAGGQLQIRDQVTGKVVKEWTSGSAPKGFRLEAGKYTLVQVTAPKGYTVARSVDFEITAEGKIIADASHLKLFGDRKILTLVNACKNNMVEFSKVTPEGKALSGASLEIYKDTTKLASWKSDAGLYRMEFEPGTYRFHEVAAPQGYKPVSDFEFEVKADGTITLGTIQNGESVALKNGRIIVTDQVDKPAPTENKKPESNTNKDKSYWVEFDVAKKDGTLLDGAVVEVYQNGKLLESWTTSATGYKTKLQPGSYRFHTKSAPKGYQLARDFNFAVNRDGSITLGKLQSGDTVTARNGKITVYGDPVSASGVRTAGTAQGGNGKLPKTGDGISPVVYAVGLVAVGAVILGIGIKKRRESVDEVK